MKNLGNSAFDAKMLSNSKFKNTNFKSKKVAQGTVVHSGITRRNSHIYLFTRNTNILQIVKY